MRPSDDTAGGGAQLPQPPQSAGEDSALDVLLDRHRPGLELCCYLMLGDRAKARTAMSETALAASAAWMRAAPAIPARTRLYRIAIDVCAEVEARER